MQCLLRSCLVQTGRHENNIFWFFSSFSFEKADMIYFDVRMTDLSLSHLNPNTSIITLKKKNVFSFFSLLQGIFKKRKPPVDQITSEPLTHKIVDKNIQVTNLQVFLS